MIYMFLSNNPSSGDIHSSINSCCNVVSDLCILVVTCWKRADLLAIVCVMFCHFLSFAMKPQNEIM